MNITQFNPNHSSVFSSNPFSAMHAFGTQGSSSDPKETGHTHHDAEDTVFRKVGKSMGHDGARHVSGRGHHGARGGVAKVLNHVREALEAAPDNAARSDLLAKAREGIQEGVTEARNILQENGQLDERMERRIDRMEKHLLRGLDHLAREHGVNESQGDQLTLSEASMMVAQFEQRSASVQIETREGDIITLELNRSAGQGQMLNAQSGEEGSSATKASARYVDMSLSYSVQGDLNEEEQAAIDALIKDASQVAESFFGGQPGAASDKAAQLSLDTETLSSFSMSLEKTSVQVALSSYRSVAALSEPTSQTQQPAEPEPEAALSDAAAGDVRQLVETAQQQEVLADPLAALPQLLESIAQAKGFDMEKIADQFQRLRDLLEGLLAHVAPAASAPLEGEAESEQATPV